MTERYTDTSDIQLGERYDAVGCPECDGRTVVDTNYSDQCCDWCKEPFEISEGKDSWIKPEP